MTAMTEQTMVSGKATFWILRIE